MVPDPHPCLRWLHVCGNGPITHHQWYPTAIPACAGSMSAGTAPSPITGGTRLPALPALAPCLRERPRHPSVSASRGSRCSAPKPVSHRLVVRAARALSLCSASQEAQPQRPRFCNSVEAARSPLRLRSARRNQAAVLARRCGAVPADVGTDARTAAVAVSGKHSSSSLWLHGPERSAPENKSLSPPKSRN